MVSLTISEVEYERHGSRRATDTPSARPSFSQGHLAADALDSSALLTSSTWARSAEEHACVCRFQCLPTCLSACLPVRLSAFLLACLFCNPICRSVLSCYLVACLFCLPICLSVLSCYLAARRYSAFLFSCLSVLASYLSICSVLLLSCPSLFCLPI